MVVAHDTEVVASATTSRQQRLQRVHILKLVHGERGEPRPDDAPASGYWSKIPRARPSMSSKSTGPSLACDARSRRRCGPSVLPGSAACDLRARRVPIEVDAVLGPLDLTGEVPTGKELVRHGNLARTGSSGALWPANSGSGSPVSRTRSPELSQRGRVEGPGLDAPDAERSSRASVPRQPSR